MFLVHTKYDRRVEGHRTFLFYIKSQCGSHTKGSRRMYSVIVTHIRCGETTGTGRPSGSKTNRAPPSAVVCREAHCLYYNLQLYSNWKVLNLTDVFIRPFHQWMSYQLSFNKVSIRDVSHECQHISMTNEFLRRSIDLRYSFCIICFRSICWMMPKHWNSCFR